MESLKPSQREKDFYGKNLENPVNLFFEKGTLSGDLIRYNKEEGKVVLTNFINRAYEEDGNSKFIEDKGEFEFDTPLIKIRSATTRKDRLGRIVKYNEDLLIEESERKKRLRGLK